MTLTPAYGRDYKSARDAQQDYLSGRNWLVADITSPWHGKPASCRDFPNQQVQLRYRQLTRVTFATWSPQK